MAKGDKVNLVEGPAPEDYHCSCEYCKRSVGELRPAAGGSYSRLERREYYSKTEQGKDAHVAKTPLHVARWAVQAYTKRGDWVLDPTIGAGTTAVEALTQGRNVAGMELQFGEVLKSNINQNKPDDVEALIRLGDARKIDDFLETIGKKFALVVNNPPYSGDEHMSTLAPDKGRHQSGTFRYQSDLPNLAFLKEGREYWEALGQIYESCIERLRPGGRFVVAVKDMMRNKQPFLLHHQIANLLKMLGLEHEGTAFLRHHPRTQFLNTYHKMYGVHPPYFQTILIFRKQPRGKR